MRITPRIRTSGISARAAGLGKGAISADANIDSFMFYGASSTANVATIILDDFKYGEDLATVPVRWEGCFTLGARASRPH